MSSKKKKLPWCQTLYVCPILLQWPSVYWQYPALWRWRCRLQWDVSSTWLATQTIGTLEISWAASRCFYWVCSWLEPQPMVAGTTSCKLQVSMVQCGTVMTRSIFSKKNCKRHTIDRPLGRDMVCLLWIESVIHILPPSLQWYMQYLAILDRVITGLNCI